MDIMMSRSFVDYYYPTEDPAGLDYSIPPPRDLDLMLWLVLFPKKFFMSLLRCT